jgi:hypothetical protein
MSVQRIRIKASELPTKIFGTSKFVKKLSFEAAFYAGTRVEKALKRDTPNDTGRMSESWKTSVTPDKRTIIIKNDAPYAAIVEFGARPHKVNREGLESIAEWAMYKLMLSSEDAKSFAFAFAKKLEKQGQKPTYFVTAHEASYNKLFSRSIHKYFKKAKGPK